jgi:hypothetical protein
MLRTGRHDPASAAVVVMLRGLKMRMGRPWAI